MEQLVPPDPRVLPESPDLPAQLELQEQPVPKVLPGRLVPQGRREPPEPTELLVRPERLAPLAQQVLRGQLALPDRPEQRELPV